GAALLELRFARIRDNGADAGPAGCEVGGRSSRLDRSSASVTGTGIAVDCNENIRAGFMARKDKPIGPTVSAHGCGETWAGSCRKEWARPATAISRVMGPLYGVSYGEQDMRRGRPDAQ